MGKRAADALCEPPAPPGSALLRGRHVPDMDRAFKAARQGMPWRFFMLFGLWSA